MVKRTVPGRPGATPPEGPGPRGGPPGRSPSEREADLRSLEERIGEALRAAEADLRASPAWGRPLPDEGDADVPPELRMAFKLLKNAGHVPPEVALMQELQAWRDELAAMPAGPQAEALKRRIGERELLIAVRIERLARTRTL
ncbi:DnaJ family domain-containing protein [Aquincola sp. MAHUQ-54]|uniref:DnaJ family domain-containing protein n=1 Tax=Aquincola agrisoli TaxID=3119538 RepID=A0AAW9QRE1_9BURK